MIPNISFIKKEKYHLTIIFNSLTKNILE